MHVFPVNQEIMSNYILLACTWLVCETGATQIQHSLLEAAAAARGQSLRVRLRCYNLDSEEECSKLEIGTATRFAWSVIKKSMAKEPTALKQY
jgi:hypothetical protein